MKKIKGTTNAFSNWSEVMDDWEDDLKAIQKELRTWKWVLWNDLPYANVVDGGFRHHISGTPVAGQMMLSSLENMITQARLPLESLGNQELSEVKAKMDAFFKDLLEKARTTQITPIRSGLLARGAEKVITYMKADPRYRDDYGFKGWSLTND